MTTIERQKELADFFQFLDELRDSGGVLSPSERAQKSLMDVE